MSPRLTQTLLLALAALLVPATALADSGESRSASRRALWQIQRELGDRLDALDALNAQLLELASRPPSGRRLRVIKDLTRQQLAVTQDLRLLHDDLRAALREGDYGRDDWDGREGWDGRGRPDRPEPVRPPAVRVPAPLPPGELEFLVASIERATFPDAQLNALRDTIQTGAFFDIAQARRVLALFVHETHKVAAATLLCPLIVEPGALPRLLSDFTFESYRQELRNRTGGQCGWVP